MIDAVSNNSSRLAYIAVPVQSASMLSNTTTANASGKPANPSIEIIAVDASSPLGKFLESDFVKQARKLLVPAAVVIGTALALFFGLASYGRHVLSKVLRRGGLEKMNRDNNLNLPEYVLNKAQRYMPGLLSPRFAGTYFKTGLDEVFNGLTKQGHHKQNLEGVYQATLKTTLLEETARMGLRQVKSKVPA